ncbi:hypothetical protein SAMN05518871_10541 [Psychrobacillus sp. OK028]|uniref:hypothetical protein n=1 Tax=Psychrobacillus sp. OK028 TaxID=1884359 RepID=UPI00088E5AE7|nr:hypothetical protein [Psychrobacillus sp. OK028]SDN39584.1 hypothetical protein SAMN05518871_10541 [Psychrobacillus sp. OK028]
MRQGFKQLIIGFLFVFLKIQIVVDILPDFIGYIFIYNGIKQIATLSSQSYEKLKILCIVLAIISVPNFFLNEQMIPQFEWLVYYPSLLSLFKIVLVYYLFVLLRVVVKLLPTDEALNRTNRMFTWYMIVTLGTSLTQSFLMNIPMDISMTLMIIVIGASFIIEISFLVYLRNIQKQFPKDNMIEKFV